MQSVVISNGDLLCTNGGYCPNFHPRPKTLPYPVKHVTFNKIYHNDTENFKYKFVTSSKKSIVGITLNGDLVLFGDIIKKCGDHIIKGNFTRAALSQYNFLVAIDKLGYIHHMYSGINKSEIYSAKFFDVRIYEGEIVALDNDGYLYVHDSRTSSYKKVSNLKFRSLNTSVGMRATSVFRRWWSSFSGIYAVGIDGNLYKYEDGKIVKDKSGDFEKISFYNDRLVCIDNNGALWVQADEADKNIVGLKHCSGQILQKVCRMADGIESPKFIDIIVTDHLMALDSEGNVWSCGKNKNGRLGFVDHKHKYMKERRRLTRVPNLKVDTLQNCVNH